MPSGVGVVGQRLSIDLERCPGLPGDAASHGMRVATLEDAPMVVKSHKPRILNTPKVKRAKSAEKNCLPGLIKGLLQKALNTNTLMRDGLEYP